jgi:hypothetical protein
MEKTVLAVGAVSAIAARGRGEETAPRLGAAEAD